MPVPGGFVLFRVINRTSPDPSALSAQKTELSESIREREAQKLMRATLQQMRADRQVKVNEEVLQTFVPEVNRRTL